MIYSIHLDKKKKILDGEIGVKAIHFYAIHEPNPIWWDFEFKSFCIGSAL